ncbi:MAG TPA: FAD-binding protein [Candidatus Stackebrandtia excrementipullorum]|nr:FAD-binding protein [Candidatus Stackebrandtia excrementipullorum]
MTISSNKWANWAGTATTRPRQIAAPRDVDELADLVARTRERDGRIKAVGAGHSFTAIAAAADILVRLDGYQPAPVVDEAARRVTVGAGTTLRDLNRLLAEHGLALPNLGDIDVQTIAGAVATGTHGTGADLGGLATFVTGLTMVDGTGIVHRYQDDDPDLAAVAVNLGALGIVTDITLQCVPAFRLHADERPMRLARVLEEFDTLAADNDHFEFYWFPRSDRALVKRNNREGHAPPLSKMRGWFDDEFLSNQVFGLMCRLGKATPRLVPAITAVSSRAQSARSYTDRSDRVFCSPRKVRFVEMEYAVPRAAYNEAFAGVRKAADRHRVVFPVEVRVAAADDTWMSTAYGRDSAYFAVHQFQGMPYLDYFAEVEAVMRDLGGRPHWGKLHTRAASDLVGDYPRMAEFTRLRDRLDPDRLFINPYLQRILG